MTTEEAFKIFVRHGSRFRYYSVKEIFQYAWYSQYWGKAGYNSYEKRDWMTPDLLAAFEWFLDQAGRDRGYMIGRDKGQMTREELSKFEKDVENTCREKERAKWESRRKSSEKREKMLEKQGKEFLKNMQIGEVYMVKFSDIWGERGILVMEIDPASISGFYLDHKDKIVPGDASEKEGYMYTKPSKYTSVKVNGEYVPGKFEWDGKSFIKTRTYETKMAKFIKRKIENPVIIKK